MTCVVFVVFSVSALLLLGESNFLTENKNHVLTFIFVILGLICSIFYILIKKQFTALKKLLETKNIKAISPPNVFEVDGQVFYFVGIETVGQESFVLLQSSGEKENPQSIQVRVWTFRYKSYYIYASILYVSLSLISVYFEISYTWFIWALPPFLVWLIAGLINLDKKNTDVALTKEGFWRVKNSRSLQIYERASQTFVLSKEKRMGYIILSESEIKKIKVS